MLNLGRTFVVTAVAVAIQGCVASKTMTPSFGDQSYSTVDEALIAASEYYNDARSNIEPRAQPLINDNLRIFDIPSKEFEKLIRAKNYRIPTTSEQISYLAKVDEMDLSHYIESAKKRNIFKNFVEIQDPLFDLSVTPEVNRSGWLLYPSVQSNQEVKFTLRSPSSVEKEITLDRGLGTAGQVTADFVNKLETATAILKQTKEAPKVADSIEEWEVITNVDPITDKQIAIAAVRAQSSSNEQILYLRCNGGEVDIYINFNEFLGIKSLPLTYRLDKELALTDKWNISTDNKAVFYPYNAKSFMYKLFGSTQLTIRATPYGESPRTLVFNIKGLSKALVEHKNTCDY